MRLLLYTTSILVLGIFIIPMSVFAVDGKEPSSIMTYDTYKENIAKNCETNKPWIAPKEGGGNLVAPPIYSELTKTILEKTVQKALSAKNTPEESERLQQELDLAKLANKNTFASLEIARIQYRTTMNKVFGCAVIQSRKRTLENIIKKIEKGNFPSTKQTEIKEKIRQEGEKLKIQENNLSCIPSQADESIPSTKIVINSAIRQYCHYNEYLKYLRDNLDKNNASMLALDASIGKATGEGNNLPNTTGDWARDIAQKNSVISYEIIRANKVLPRAIEAFRDMERTYSLHLMLTIIYDDYLRLRDNLNLYFNSISQLLEKTQNAQIPNTN